MNITDVRIRTVNTDGMLKAVASITIDDELAIHDVKILQGANGLFVAMPSRKTPDGTYKDVAHPVTQAARDALISRVLQAYNERLSNE